MVESVRQVEHCLGRGFGAIPCRGAGIRGGQQVHDSSRQEVLPDNAPPGPQTSDAHSDRTLKEM